MVDPEHTKGLGYDRWLDPKPFFEAQARILRDTLTVSSDLLPVMPINHLGDATITSMFGAEQFMPTEAGATLQDVGPAPMPVLSGIEDVSRLAMPGMDAGIIPDVERMMSYYREHLPRWVHVVSPGPAGPFSTAMELRGSEILFELTQRPDLCSRLIEMCAQLQVEVECRLRRQSGEPLDRHITNFGILGTGLRLGEDSMVNLSPAMIREFCLPGFRVVNRACGGQGHVHFCSLDGRRFEHIYAALAEAGEVAVISSQFGFEYYQEHLEELRGRLAVESFYGDALGYCIEEHGSFEEWAGWFVPRFKDESGLVLYAQVSTVEEGKRYWEIWQRAHGT